LGTKVTSNDLSTQLLAWYDEHARELPWRVGPSESVLGHKQDPYKTWLSEIMLQQTTVATVKDYFRRFTERWPTVEELAAAADEDVLGEWAGLGYYARARNLLKCARQVCAEYGSVFPQQYDELIKLPGIGPYTAAAVASIAFGKPETIVDGNVERVISRLEYIEEPLPNSKKTITEHAANITPTLRAGDYAQAIMDLGATVCKPKAPMCDVCPWSESCKARKEGNQESFPRKLPKKVKPTRHGYVYVAQTAQHEWMLIKREDKGLLGGMMCWPTSDWNEAPEAAPPVVAVWQGLGEIKHTFTHFHLILNVQFAAEIDAPSGSILKGHNEFNASELPTVMRKAFDLVVKTLDGDHRLP